MNRRKEIADELKNIAPTLAGIDFQHPYRVPAGYFENLPEQVMLRIRLENASSAKEELEAISPFLSGLSKKMPFSAPEGYFDALTPRIRVAENASHEPALVVKMFQPRRTFRMAAAAVAIGIIGIAAWLIMREPATNPYATKTDMEVQEELKNKVGEISENELAYYIEGNNNITFTDSTSMVEIGEEDVKLMLADIPDQELEKYLDQHSAKENYN
jgi:hypothetical protein